MSRKICFAKCVCLCVFVSWHRNMKTCYLPFCFHASDRSSCFLLGRNCRLFVFVWHEDNEEGFSFVLFCFGLLLCAMCSKCENRARISLTKTNSVPSSSIETGNTAGQESNWSFVSTRWKTHATLINRKIYSLENFLSIGCSERQMAKLTIWRRLSGRSASCQPSANVSTLTKISVTYF